MNIIFFNSHTFLTKEIINSLKKRLDHQSIIVNIPQYPAAIQVNSIFEQLKNYLPGLVLIINDAGCDYNGVLIKKLIDCGCLIANWYHDYPFYEAIFQGRQTFPSPARIDFVSEKSFLPEMVERGFNAHFLPLATDISFFHPSESVELTRDVAFVGNSSCGFLDSIMTEERVRELEKLLPLQVLIKKKYIADPRFDIFHFLLENKRLWQGKTSLKDDELLFCIEWMIGYLYRRDFIKAIASRYKTRFFCFGDPYWKNFLDPSLVSTEACYYTNLCDIYKSTKVNINVNRIQIRTSFTQRIFDCAASGAFIITEKRECNKQFFKTGGTGQELVEFESIGQCTDLIDYYLVHEEERKTIAEAAYQNVTRYHTYDIRISQMLETCRKYWKL